MHGWHCNIRVKIPMHFFKASILIGSYQLFHGVLTERTDYQQCIQSLPTPAAVDWAWSADMQSIVHAAA